MRGENKRKEAILILGLTIILLYILSFIKIDYEIAGLKLKTIDIFLDIRSDNSSDSGKNHSFHLQHNNYFLSEANIFSSIVHIFESPKDNLNFTALSQGVKTKITGNTKQLSYFFDALKNIKSKPVRIAHYGDSIIEGDLITADIREALQKKYGGNAVGWLGIVSQDITFRTTTKHTFSDNWENATIYTNNPKKLPFGISGEVAIPKGNAWVQYETTRIRKTLKDFTIVKLYYSHAKNSQIYYSFDGGPKQTAQLKTGTNIQELTLVPNGKAQSIRIEFPIAEQAYVYGVSLENESGIFVDNFPLRGNSGVDLNQISLNVLKDFSKYRDYNLIILEFGLNILGTTTTDYNWYEREMTKVINLFKSAYPKASIIMISVHDKAMKKGSNFVTDPAVLKLLEAQKKIAEKNNIAFWNLFEAMGGENSMQKWVNSNPPLAFKDYVHFNDQGAAKIAQLFVESLLEEFK
ncbi:MAG: hypothetical protein N2249_07930 [Melioribacter sp.]|nr:hypothetical protein [Melioribacter sp.]